MAEPERPTLMIEHSKTFEQVCKNQRERGNKVDIQTSCFSSVSSHISSIALTSTARSTQNRFNRYKEFCEQSAIPCFPIVGEVVAIWLWEVSGGEEEGWKEGKTWDSHTTVMNAVRRTTLPYFSTPSTPPQTHALTSSNILDFPPLKQYTAICRSYAQLTRGSRLAQATLDSPARSTQKRKAAQAALEVPRTPASTSKRQRKSVSPAPSAGTPSRRSARKSEVAPRQASPDSDYEEAPKPVVQRRRKNPNPLPKSKSAASLLSPPAAAAKTLAKSASTSTLAKRGRGRPRLIPVEVKDVVKEEVKKMAPEEATDGGQGPEGVGIFGKITRWFGWGA